MLEHTKFNIVYPYQYQFYFMVGVTTGNAIICDTGFIGKTTDASLSNHITLIGSGNFSATKISNTVGVQYDFRSLYGSVIIFSIDKPTITLL